MGLNSCLGRIQPAAGRWRGAVAFADRRARLRERGQSSDGGGELGERCGDAELARGIEAEFVVAAA
jgi:hypothetical protein